MLTVFVADIFGKSEALQQLAEQVAGQETLIIDAYAGQCIDFKNEQAAYDYFSEQVGLSQYAQLLQEKLSSIKQPFNLIAFSVGGSAVWLNSAMLANTQVNRVVCFYASQIRHYLSIQPSILIELILPKSELHFDITEFAQNLHKKQRVKIIHSQYFHGFMNKLSLHYDPLGFQGYVHKLPLNKES
ncbi:hypothetical protein [Psychromonas hadalis]|uniref:hypothetical protein n=1 Tax=Psychromonas hadalis TaxID=211669 RepID=UPI0003B5C866|nr:hypothetical protein [Psychromonas hadalis]